MVRDSQLALVAEVPGGNFTGDYGIFAETSFE